MSDDFERKVRDSLRAHAADAPVSDEVVDRVLDSLEGTRPRLPDRVRRRMVAVPVLAAAAVVVIAVGVVLVPRGDDGAERAASPRTPAQLSASAVTAAPPAPESNKAPGRSSAQTASLRGVRVLDLTFTASDDGWALASARCTEDPSRRCTAILRSTDGISWTGQAGTPPFRVAGATGGGPLVDHLRFATDDIGYAYGPGALFMTTNGGRQWQQQQGGALSLETADGNVVRLLSDNSGVQVQTARIGTSDWTSRALGGHPGDGASGAFLSRTNRDVYVLLIGVGPDDPSTASLYRSGDDGRTWQSVTSACPYPGGYQATGVAAGADGRVAVTCRLPQTPEARLAISVDAGAAFTDHGSLPQRSGFLAVGPPGVYLLALDTLSRTTDSGGHWRSVAGIDPGFISLGFESDEIGRIVADNGTTIWTTRNGGDSWRILRLP